MLCESDEIDVVTPGTRAFTPLHVLVATAALGLGRTSAGIGTSKFAAALTKAGHRVSCLTNDESLGEHGSSFALPWLPGVDVHHVNATPWSGRWELLARTRERLSASRPGARVCRRMKAAFAYGTGHSSEVWCRVDRWMQAMQETVTRLRPDVIFVRGAGGCFDPHMALLRWTPPVPWVANYHDPYPQSLYPEPYRNRVRLVSRQQETIHRRILAAADALTFPSARLLDWVLDAEPRAYREKAFVVPHIASELRAQGSADLPASQAVPPSKPFSIVHAGTLLGPRDPRGLLRGFYDFVQSDPEKRANAQLVFVGSINRTHLEYPEWELLQQGGNLVRLDQRVGYARAVAITRSAVSLVIMEADCVESPFFPGKLADYLCLEKPILALSPKLSATADLLGPDYPLRLKPDDSRSIAAALDLLWTHWKNGSMRHLVPPEAVRVGVSAGTVAARAADAFAFARNARSLR